MLERFYNTVSYYNHSIHCTSCSFLHVLAVRLQVLSIAFTIYSLCCLRLRFAFPDYALTTSQYILTDLCISSVSNDILVLFVSWHCLPVLNQPLQHSCSFVSVRCASVPTSCMSSMSVPGRFMQHCHWDCLFRFWVVLYLSWCTARHDRLGAWTIATVTTRHAKP